MNILISTRFIPIRNGVYQPSTGEHAAEGFKSLGHQVIVYGNVYGTHQFKGHEELKNIDRIHVYVEMECNDSDAPLTAIKNHYKVKGAKHIYWDFDSSFQLEYNLIKAQRSNADYYAIANVDNKVIFEERLGKPTFSLPYGFNPNFHRPLDVDKEFKVGFIGSLTNERKETIKQLRDAGIELLVQEGVYGEELIKQTNRLFLMFHENQPGAGSLLCGRHMECMGIGIPLLLSRSDADKAYKAGYPIEHCVIFNDIPHLVEILKNLGEAELLEMGRALRATGLEKHTYAQRAQTILKNIK